MDFKLKKSNLNFRVYTATTAPATGTENDICVISSVPMKNWILSPDAPGGTPRNDGDVWITYTVTSMHVFNAVKNAYMMIAPFDAKQYVNGEWVHVPAMTYQNGKWDAWKFLLYNEGDKCDSITGGWTKAESSGSSGSTVTFNTDKMTIEKCYGGSISTRTKNVVNLSPYRSIGVEFTASSSAPFISIRVLNSSNSEIKSQVVTYSGGVRTRAELDVSDIASGYVDIRAYGNAACAAATVDIHCVALRE